MGHSVECTIVYHVADLHVHDIKHAMQHLSLHHIVIFSVGSERWRCIHFQQPRLQILVDDDIIPYEKFDELF